MGDTAAAFGGRRLARTTMPSEAVTVGTFREGISAIRASDESIKRIGDAVASLVLETQQTMASASDETVRSVEKNTEQMHDSVEEMSDEATKRNESFLMRFGKRIAGVIPRDAKGLLEWVGFGALGPEVALATKGFRLLTPALGALGTAAAVAGAAWAGFKAGNWLYEAIFPEGGKWVERQWEVLFGDLREKGLRVWSEQAAKEVWAGVTGKAGQQVARLEREIPQTRVALGGAERITRLLGEIAAERGMTTAAAGRVRGMLGAEEIANIVSVGVSTQYATLTELMERYGRQQLDIIEKKVEGRVTQRLLARPGAGWRREEMPLLAEEIDQLMRTFSALEVQAKDRAREIYGLRGEQLLNVMKSANDMSQKQTVDLITALDHVVAELQLGRKGQERFQAERRGQLGGVVTKEPDLNNDMPALVSRGQ